MSVSLINLNLLGLLFRCKISYYFRFNTCILVGAHSVNTKQFKKQGPKCANAISGLKTEPTVLFNQETEKYFFPGTECDILYIGPTTSRTRPSGAVLSKQEASTWTSQFPPPPPLPHPAPTRCSPLPESIEWYIVGQAFLRSSDLAPHPTPSHPLPSESLTGDTQEDWERQISCW